MRGPGYASPVKFWVPVKGGIGIHDASWRKEFGGDIYQTAGSHGCINTPKDKMEELYDMRTDRYPCRNVLLIKQTFSDKMSVSGCEHFENNLTM